MCLSSVKINGNGRFAVWSSRLLMSIYDLVELGTQDKPFSKIVVELLLGLATAVCWRF